MTKLEKLERDREKAREKIAGYQARLKELDGAVTQQENVQIVEAVRALKLTREELRHFIGGGTLPKGVPGTEAMPAARYQKKKPEEKAAVPDADTKPTPAATTYPTDNESEGKKDEE
jgi:hypothetical protein